jgi:hypothetical protein
LWVNLTLFSSQARPRDVRLLRRRTAVTTPPLQQM